MTDEQKKKHKESEKKRLEEFKKNLKANNHNQQNNQNNNSNSSKQQNSNSQSQNSNNSNNSTSNSSTKQSKKQDDEAGSLLQTMMSNSHARQSEPNVIFHERKRYIQQNATYRVQKNASHPSDEHDGLCDRGANGGFGGGNTIPVSLSDTQKVNVVGIKQAKCSDLPVGTLASKVKTDTSSVIGLFNLV